MKPGITSKNKRANQENWFTPSHHKYDPITYPNIAPKIEPNEHINAKRNAFVLNPKAKGIKRTSGGSTGSKYLNKTTEKHRVFQDINQLTTFLIPRSSLPELPEKVKNDFGFYYHIRKK
ncbi:hypothetical protein OAQ57_02065 [Candidatus Marinimicrobia bacterium]|nr:hypothetical protein [Candidatus Neomarinimicrobiota bacterium]